MISSSLLFSYFLLKIKRSVECITLRNLLRFAQFKKREKHPLQKAFQIKTKHQKNMKDNWRDAYKTKTKKY